MVPAIEGQIKLMVSENNEKTYQFRESLSPKIAGIEESRDVDGAYHDDRSHDQRRTSLEHLALKVRRIRDRLRCPRRSALDIARRYNLLRLIYRQIGKEVARVGAAILVA